MITLAGRQYDLTFVGNTDFEEAAGATLSVDAWGLDTSTRKFKGAITKLAAFVAGIRRQRGYRDPIYSGLTLDTYQATENGPFGEVSINFKGTHDGSMPGPLPPATDSSLETVTLAQYDGAESDSPTVEVSYYSPITTWRYVARSRPKAPQFRGELEGNQEITYIGRRGGQGELNIYAGGNLGTAISVDPRKLGMYNGVAITITKGPRVTPAGRYFECEETVQRMIVPFDIANINWSASVG